MLAAHFVRRRYGHGELLFSEGDPCRGLYIIESGKLRIFKSSPNGREQVLAVEGPGGSVAELPVFDGGPYPASASTVEIPRSSSFPDRTCAASVSSTPRSPSKCWLLSGPGFAGWWASSRSYPSLPFASVSLPLLSVCAGYGQTDRSRDRVRARRYSPGNGTSAWHRPRTRLAQPDAPPGRRPPRGRGPQHRRSRHVRPFRAP